MSHRVNFRRLLARARSIEALAPMGQWLPCRIEWRRSASGLTPILTCVAGDVATSVPLRVVMEPGCKKRIENALRRNFAAMNFDPRSRLEIIRPQTKKELSLPAGSAASPPHALKELFDGQ